MRLGEGQEALGLGEVLARGSNIEWCEARVAGYAFSPYVSELGNTLSSLVYVLPALAMLLRRRAYRLPLAFYATDLVMILVGLGSAVFHATGSYVGEMLDEVPMSFLALGYLFQLQGRHGWCETGSRSWRRLTSGAVALTLGSWMIYSTTRNFEVFKTAFTLLLVTASALLLTAKPPREGRGFFFVQVACVLIAKAAWELERSLFRQDACPTSPAKPAYYLHTIWHVFGAAAHYFAQSYSERQCLAVGAVVFHDSELVKGG